MFVDDDDDDGDTTAAAKIVRKGNSRGRRRAKIDERWRRRPLGAIGNLQAQNDQEVKSNKRTPSDGSDICALGKELADNHANATLILNRLKEAERQLESTTKKLLLHEIAAKLLRKKNSELKSEVATVKGIYETLHDLATKKLLLLENDLASVHANVKRDYEHDKEVLRKESETKFATLTNVALSAKEEVVKVLRKYDTLASEYANFVANSREKFATVEEAVTNVKRDYEHDLAILNSRINQKDEELNDSIAQITQFKVQISTLMEEKDQLAMKLDDEDQCKECVVCKESRKEYAFLPCRHMCVCEGCAASIQGKDRKCPLCRGVSTSTTKIFH